MTESISSTSRAVTAENSILSNIRQRPGQEPGDYDGVTTVKTPDKETLFRPQCWCGWRGQFSSDSQIAWDDWTEHHTVEQHR